MMIENFMPYWSVQNSDKLSLVKVTYTDREMLLIDPKPGTAAAAARDFGIDLSVTVGNLRLTPEQGSSNSMIFKRQSQSCEKR